jgi:hypothetical protein
MLQHPMDRLRKLPVTIFTAPLTIAIMLQRTNGCLVWIENWISSLV